MFSGRGGLVTLVGVTLTIFYLILFSSYVLLNWNAISDLDPNELGDFAAGSLGPLAILWLILGYFVQSKELRHSVEALNLQAEELRNSVAHQKEPVEVSKNALEHERLMVKQQAENEISRIRPKFSAKLDFKGDFSLSVSNAFEVTNVGGDATDVWLLSERIAHWPTGETRKFNTGLPNSVQIRRKHEIAFHDSRGNKYTDVLVTA